MAVVGEVGAPPVRRMNGIERISEAHRRLRVIEQEERKGRLLRSVRFWAVVAFVVGGFAFSTVMVLGWIG